VGRKGQWANAWEIERLTQLRADLDSSLGRMHGECVRRAVAVAPDVAEEWMRRAGLIEELREWTLRDIERWIVERSKGA
jgi:hypothetical protein